MLILFIFVMPWERNVPVRGVGAISTLIGIAALLLGVACLVERQKLKLRAPSLFLGIMILFVLWSSLSYFWSITPNLSITRSITYLQLFTMVWLIWQLCRSHQQQLTLIQAYIFGAHFTIVMVLINFLSGNPFGSGYQSSTRYTFSAGAGGDPNYIATALALGIPMAWHLISSRKGGLIHWFNLLYIPLAIFTIGLNGSRGGFITAVVALSIIPLTYWYLSIWRKVLLIAALGITLYAAFSLLPQASVDRLSGISEDIAEQNLANRQDIWRANLELLRQNQMASIFGVGSGGNGVAVEPYLGYGIVAHNTYLVVLVDNGFIGFSLFMLLVFIALIPNLYLKAPAKTFYIVLWLSLLVAIIPLGWLNVKALWFVLALLTTQKAYILAVPGLSFQKGSWESPHPATLKTRDKAYS